MSLKCVNKYFQPNGAKKGKRKVFTYSMHIKLKFKLQPAMKAQRWNRDILYIFTLSLTSALKVGWMAITTPKNSSVQEVVWAPGPVCLLEEFVRNHECSVKRIISTKLIGNNVEVREGSLYGSNYYLLSVWIEGSNHDKNHLVFSEV